MGRFLKIAMSKLWYIGQIYTFPKYIKKELKKEYTISSVTRKNRTSQTPSLSFHLEWRTRYFGHRHTIKLYKNKMDSKVIQSHHCSLEWFHAVLIEINPGLWSRPSPFKQKQILTGLLVTQIYKNKTMKISLFNYSMLGCI